MQIPAGKSYTIEVEQIRHTGMNYVVRAYRKSFIFKKLISSDWFLDGDQAIRFAQQLALDLRNGTKVESLKSRNPGWTLHRPAH